MIWHKRSIRIQGMNLAAAMVCAFAATGQARAVTTDELAQKLDALEKQNAALQAKVNKLEAAQAQQSSQAQQAPAAGPVPQPAPTPG
jgi:cell division protein FtsB